MSRIVISAAVAQRPITSSSSWRMRGSRPTVGSSRNSTCGLGDERAGDLEPAALAAAVARDGPVEELGEAERLGELADAAPAAPGSTPPEAGVDVEVAAAGQCAVDDRVLEHDAADAAGGERLARDVEAGDARAAAGRGDGGREHADRGRLAGAVRTEQAEHLAGGDLEVDALDGLDAARVGLAQLAHVDRGLPEPRDEFGSGLHELSCFGWEGEAACRGRRRHIGRRWFVTAMTAPNGRM